MSNPTVIVSHKRIQESLAGDFEAVAQRAFEVVEELTKAEVYSKLGHGLQVLEAEEIHPEVLVSPRNRTVSLLQAYIAKQAATDANRDRVLKPVAPGGFEAKFNQYDILGWVGSFFHWWRGLFPRDFIDWDGRIDPIGNPARVALLSDWGTGLYGAPVCSDSIENDPRGFQSILHLGDVYYAGSRSEVKDNFLQHWPSVDQAVNRSLNGNHEMYTGGRGYFELLLPAFRQQSSFCVMQNDYWTLVGLDTAYDEWSLEGDQVKWLRRVVDDSGDRKTILFSHHQPFSILGDIDREPKFVGQLANLLDQGKIFAWYWGHEHECILYDPHMAWGFLGRCVGFSGFPQFRKVEQLGPTPSDLEWKRLERHNPVVPGAKVLNGPNKYIRGYESEYVPHGYLVLNFDGPRLVEQIYDADGTLFDENHLV